MSENAIILPQNPTTEPSIATDEEVVQFSWRTPEPGDAGIIIGGSPNNPMKLKNFFYLVLRIVEPKYGAFNYSALGLTPVLCLVTDREKQITTQETLGVQWFITSDKPIPGLFSGHGLKELRSMIGSFSLRQLIDHKIIV